MEKTMTMKEKEEEKVKDSERAFVRWLVCLKFMSFKYGNNTGILYHRVSQSFVIKEHFIVEITRGPPFMFK